KAIQELQVWIAENLRKKLLVQPLSDSAAKSNGSFERVFTREAGRTPSQYVLKERVEAVHQPLDRTDRGLERIAVACGVWSAGVMRRSFSRFVGVPPNQYRGRTRSLTPAG